MHDRSVLLFALMVHKVTEVLLKYNKNIKKIL